MWTVYHSPTDCPGRYVARLFENGQPTGEAIVSATLIGIISEMEARGLIFLPRSPGDEPQVLGVWI
jgi:hypothetical protein